MHAVMLAITVGGRRSRGPAHDDYRRAFLNMRRMLKDNVLVRKLVGIETSGSLNILFTDKTGTLTRGQLEVTAFVGGDGMEHKASPVKTKELWDLIELSVTSTTAAPCRPDARSGETRQTEPF